MTSGMTNAMTGAVRLRAVDEEDLKVVSACLQDAIVPIGDMIYLPDERRFILVANRFRWETVTSRARESQDADLFPYERVHTGVRFDEVSAVRLRGVDLRDRGQMLELLSLAWEEGAVELTFSGGASIRLETPRLACLIEDVGDPWPTFHLPQHGEEE